MHKERYSNLHNFLGKGNNKRIDWILDNISCELNFIPNINKYKMEN